MPYSLPTVEPKQLIPCDILQFSGKSFVNKAIQYFDASYVNHSAQWTGRGVAGALTNGYVEVGLEDAITEDDVYVDVIRFCGDPNDMMGTQLGSFAYPYEPVLEQINLRLSNGLKYNYPSILLLAVICEIRRLTNSSLYTRMAIDKTAKALLRQLIDGNIVLKLIEDGYSNGKEMNICSQAVYSNFACAGDKYRPTILPESMHNSYRDVIQNKIDESTLLKKFNELHTDEKGLMTDFITPGDMSMSPNVCYQLGRLKFKHLKTDL